MKRLLAIVLLLIASPACAQSRLPDALGQAMCRITNGNSAGSGTLIGKDERSGLVVSCFHLFAEGVFQVGIHFPNGENFAGNVIATDRVNDLSAIIIAAPKAEPVAVPDYKPVKGEPLWSAGFGSDRILAVNYGPVVKYTDRGDNSWRGFKISGMARPGDSGGPIFNDKGELAGVLWGAGDGEVAGTGNQLVNTMLLQCADGSCAPRRPTYWRPAQPEQRPPRIVEPPMKPVPPKPNPPATAGAQGPQGPAGPAGPQGPPGEDADSESLKAEIAVLRLEINNMRQQATDALPGLATKADVENAIKGLKPITAEIWSDGKLVGRRQVPLGGTLPLERYLIGGKPPNTMRSK